MSTKGLDERLMNPAFAVPFSLSGLAVLNAVPCTHNWFIMVAEDSHAVVFLTRHVDAPLS